MHQCQPTLATGNLIQRFHAFYFSTVKSYALFQGQRALFHILCHRTGLSLLARTANSCVCLCVERDKHEPLSTSLTEAEGEVAAMAAKVTDHPWHQQRCFPSSCQRSPRGAYLHISQAADQQEIIISDKKMMARVKGGS